MAFETAVPLAEKRARTTEKGRREREELGDPSSNDEAHSEVDGRARNNSEIERLPTDQG